MRLVSLSITLIVLLCPTTVSSDPLPSWQNGASKQSITSFVRLVTSPGEGYVRASERIAVFDNDGTLWAEQPLYFQLAFAMDRVKAMGNDHPEWADKEPFKSVLADDMPGVLKSGKAGLGKLLAVSHAGMSVEEFHSIVREWIGNAHHPTTNKRYIQMVYQPMLELLAYLRANGFKTYIVSGGGIEFMRVFAERVYGIPPEQVIGTSIKTKFEMTNGEPRLVRLPELNFLDDKDGKPIAINQHIGRRPILAFGNSDGDLQMLQWTAAGDGPRLMGLVHHTDSEREWAYDRDSHIGRLDQALDAAKKNRWTVVNMKYDWRTVYAQ